MTYKKWRGEPVNELNSFDYARYKIEEGLALCEELHAVSGGEEPNWYPNSWEMAFVLNIPGLARRWLEEQEGEE